MNSNMDFADKIKDLQGEIQKKLRNRLTFINSILDLDRVLSKEEREKGKEDIRQCLKIVEAKFLTFLMELEDRGQGDRT